MDQTLHDLFLKPAEVASLPALAISLILAAILGLVLGSVYVRCAMSLSNRRQFARNFLLLTVTTTLIISIVKSSLALSLGLVGALSIVRFRAAIKEPEELAYLFLAISVGLGLGAGQPLLTLVAFAIILTLIALRHLARTAPAPPNLFVTITTPSPDKLDVTRILEAISATGAQAVLRRVDDTPELFEASFLVNFHDVTRLEQFSRRLRELCPTARVSCLDDQGLAA
jgi:uncharacterized membrane protein YhiD involved in acid resistance